MRFPVLSLFLLVFVSGSVALENPAPVVNDSLSHKRIPEIEVQGLFAEKLNFPLLAVDAENMEKRAYVTPADALNYTPGVLISRDGIWATSVNIRGLAESKLLFMVDGDRMQTASDIAGALSTVDMENVERIEVVKGAGSVLFGTGAMGGVVNFVQKRPGYTDMLNISGDFMTGFHTVNDLWQNHLAVNASDQDWYLTVNGSYRAAGNTMTPAGKLPNSQLNDASVSVRGGMRYHDSQELLVGYDHFEAWDTGIPGGNAFPAAATVRYLGFERNHLSGEYVFSDLTEVLKALKFRAYTQNISRSVENEANPNLVILPASMNVTSGLKASADLYFNDYHQMTVGAEGWLRDQKTSRYRIALSPDTTVTGEQPTPAATMLDAGVFAKYSWKPDPKYWTVNAGVRMDFIRTVNDTAFREIVKYKYVNGERTDVDPDKTVLFGRDRSRELAYSAHVDVAYKPAAGHELVLSLANAYRVASLEERFKYIDQAGILRVGNPDLKPENGFFANLGYSYSGDKLMISTDLFANYLFNLIAEKQGTYRTTAGVPVQAWINDNVGKAYFAGGELDLKWLVLAGLKFETNVSYVHAVDASTNEQLPLIPPLHGLVSFSYDVRKAGSVAFAMRWEYETDVPEGEEPHRFAVCDLYANTLPVKFGKVDMKFYGGVQNIFDKSYVEYLSTLRGTDILEPGRNIFIKAKVLW